MAVELRCPACRAKLKLKEDPDPGTEIECSRCGETFPWEENLVLAGSADDADDGPRRRKAAAAAAEDADGGPRQAEKKTTTKTSTKPKPAPASGPAPGPEKSKRKKKRKKKKKTKPAILVAIIVGAVVSIGSVAGFFIWFLTKKSMSQEMMTYLPDDCDEVIGLNLGHMQKYPEFYKECSSTFANTGFRKAGDALAKVLGKQDLSAAVEYVVQGSGRAGGTASGPPLEATVMRVKEEFDTGLIGKLPGARKYTASGVDYYTIDDPGFGYPGGVRVFAPTNRLVVFCNGNIPENKFKSMLTGNDGNLDATAYVRAGPLSKQVSRGTAWKFILYGRSVARYTGPPPKSAGQGASADQNPEELLQKEVADILAQAQGSGYKASVGSRDLRGEWIVWYKDSDTAAEMAKKWREKDWVKDDEKELPRWFKSLAQKSGIGKTAENVIRDGLSFRSSGELFSVRTSAETVLFQTGGIGQLVQNFTGQSPGGGGGAMPGGMMPGGAMPGGAMPGPSPRRRPVGLVRPRRRRLQSQR